MVEEWWWRIQFVWVEAAVSANINAANSVSAPTVVVPECFVVGVFGRSNCIGRSNDMYRSNSICQIRIVDHILFVGQNHGRSNSFSIFNPIGRSNFICRSNLFVDQIIPLFRFLIDDHIKLIDQILRVGHIPGISQIM